MRIWLDRYHGAMEHHHMIDRRVFHAPSLPRFDRKALQLYEARLMQYWHIGWNSMGYTQLSEFLEQIFGRLSYEIMEGLRSPFGWMPVTPITQCGSEYGSPERSTCILCRCPRDPDYEIAAVCKMPACRSEEDGGCLPACLHGIPLGFCVVRQKVIKVLTAS